MTIDKEGNIYIVDTENHRIMKWEPGSNEGEPIIGSAGGGSELSQLNTPQGIVIDSNNNLYIADRGNKRIMKWTIGESEGEVLAQGHDNNEWIGMSQTKSRL
jgi:sugar lactone lactonase YvrE